MVRKKKKESYEKPSLRKVKCGQNTKISETIAASGSGSGSGSSGGGGGGF